MITLDGSEGEGGGQILRTALSLSACTGQPFRMHSIRASRSRPGLMRQHLTAVLATAELCDAHVDAATLGSTELTFRPGAVRAGNYAWSVGTAGSTTLVLQTVLPPLATADAPSTVVIEGGTHNPWSPPFDFVARCFVPQLRACGIDVELVLHRAGFHPAGGGRIEARIRPGPLRGLVLEQRGRLVRRHATALVANLPADIAARELMTVRRQLDFRESETTAETLRNVYGPGNVLSIEHEFEHVTEITTGFGERRKRAEQVAREAAREAKRYLKAGAPVGEHLADQLLLPLALAGKGRFRTVKPSLHTRTNCEIIEKFVPVAFAVAKLRPDVWEIRVERRRA